MNKRVISIVVLALLTALLLAAQWLFGQQQQAYPAQMAQSPRHHTSTPANAGQVRPATTTPTIGMPTVTPTLIAVNTPTLVTVTATITDPTLIRGSVNLLRLGATGTQPTILGVMQTTGNGIYSLRLNFDEPAPGQIQLRVSAAFQGRLARILSSPTTLPVWNHYSNTGVGISVDFPSDLYPLSASSTSPNTFVIQSSQQYVAVGEPLDNAGTEPVDGFLISFSSSTTPDQQFDINTWVSDTLPGAAVDTLTQGTVQGAPAYTLTFSDAYTPRYLIVIPRGTTIYEIEYNSSFEPGTPEDNNGLAHFQTLLQQIRFLR